MQQKNGRRMIVRPFFELRKTVSVKRLAMKLFLCASALFAAWTAFAAGTGANATESIPTPPRFQKVMVVFSADMAKEDRDAFLAGLEQVRLRHQKDYREIVRKWRESAPSEPERKTGTDRTSDSPAKSGSGAQHDFERAFYHNPFFLNVVDVHLVRTDLANPFFSVDPGAADFPLWDMESLRGRFGSDEGGRGEALIVVASGEIAASVNRMIRNDFFEPGRNETVILFAGVPSFDESVRAPQMKGNVREFAKAPYAFAILHPVDPWPNTELALSTFPGTKKVILLTSGTGWTPEKETSFRAKLGPGKTLKTIPVPEIPKRDATEADIEALREKFAATLNAEIAPDTVVVTLSSVETGQDPAWWLPEDFNACPVFTDTKPVHAAAVGGFCRSMTDLGVQAAELLEHLSEEPLIRNKLPAVIMEEDRLRLNAAALRLFELKESSFPENPIMTDSESAGGAPEDDRPWIRRHIVFIHVTGGVAILGFFGVVLLFVRARLRKRRLVELIYGVLPVRVLVTDRDGRIIAHHDQYGELEQKGEFLWKSIGEVPWLQGTGALKLVHDVFDSGKTVVHEMEIDGERRTVVLARTPSDVFGRPAVIAVSGISPKEEKKA